MASGWEYLDNGTIKVGMLMDQGGCIAYISESGSSVNMCHVPPDMGGNIQPSFWGRSYTYELGFYEGTVFRGFNPIQAGDKYNENRYVDDATLNSNEVDSFYCKVPMMQWAVNEDYPRPEWQLEQWVTLIGATIKVRYKFTYAHAWDRRPLDLCYNDSGYWDQECPAVFFNGALKKFVTYTGDNPWSGGELTEFYNDTTPLYTKGLPDFRPSERWAAVVDAETNFGVGVYNPECANILCNPFIGALTEEWSTYCAPIIEHAFAPNSTFEFNSYFAVGTAEQIREQFSAIRESAIPKGLIIVRSPDDTVDNLYFRGVAGATAYRLYLDGVRYPDASTEIVNPFYRFTESAVGDLTVAAVVDELEGEQSVSVAVNLEISTAPILTPSGNSGGILLTPSGQSGGTLMRKKNGSWITN